MAEATSLAALRAWERYRQREGNPPPAALPLRRAGDGEAGVASRRREELVRERVDHAALSRLHAEMIYDIAVEEGLDPVFAFELVASGVAVCDAPQGDGDAVQETIVEATPEWISPTGVSEPVATEDVVRERRLRVSFRRLRGELERWPTAEEAIAAFANEPDVGDCGYLLD